MRQGVHPSLLQSFFSRSEQPRGVPMNSMRLRTAEFQLVLHAGRPRVRSPGGRVCPNFKCGAGLNGPVNNSIKGREGNLAVSFRCVGAGTRLKQFPPRTRENKVCTVHWTDTTARDVLVPTHKFKALWTPTPNKQRLSWCMFDFLLVSSLWFAPVVTSCYWSCDSCDWKKCFHCSFS